MIRRYGYAPKRQRVYGLTSKHRGPCASLIAVHIGHDFAEPSLFKRTRDTEVFSSWLKTNLCPHFNHDQLVIMDTATLHKSPERGQLIEESCATLLFLPPYSSDLNPIEHDFAALKKSRRVR